MMKRILVVDDDPDILDAIKLTLEDAGYMVMTTQDAVYAEKIHEKKERPDVIVLDVLLSGHDGRTVVKKLKKNPRTSTIPVLMISAHPTAYKSTIESGADEFLAKPFDIDELLGKIEGLLNHSP